MKTKRSEYLDFNAKWSIDFIFK